MAIYRTGQASMDAQGYITGYGTKWREQLTLIRAGATIIFLSNPLQFGVITEVVNDTSMRAITTNGAVVAKTNYIILLHDSLTVDGLAQDVAETLRYYQGKETQFESFIEFLENFDFAKLESLTNQTIQKAAEAKTSATNAKNSETAAKNSQTAAKTSETNAKASETAANNSKNAAATSATNAKASETAANNSKNAAATSATNAKNSENAAKAAQSQAEGAEAAAMASEEAAAASAAAAKASQNAAKTSETNAKTSETNANNSKNAAASSASAAKTSETNAKTSENKAKEYSDKAASFAFPMTQYDWPVVTGAESFYIKIAKLTDPSSNNSHITLMVTNGGNYGSTYGNIDFIEISARGLPSSLTADNVSRYLNIRRLGSTSLDETNQMRYGLVKGDGFIEVWAFQRAFINGAKVAVLAQTARTELYIPNGFVKQTAAPAGYVESSAIRIYDEANKPTKADLGLANAMLVGDFGLGGNGPSTNGKMSDVEILKALRDKGGHFWRADKPTGSTATIYSHGSGIFSRCGDTWSAINIDYATGKVKIYSGNDNGLNNGTFKVNELYGAANKPSKSDVGLGNVSNDAQVKKAGDTMTGDLEIQKGTPSIRLKSASGNAHLWFQNSDGGERGVIWAEPNTADKGTVRIRAKTTGGTTGGDVIIHHTGKIETNSSQVNGKAQSRTIEVTNPDTATDAISVKVSGAQHTPLVFYRESQTSNLSIGFKLKDMNLKRLGVDIDGDLSYGENPDQKQNSKVVTLAMLNKDQTLGGAYIFSKLVTFNAGFAGSWEPENISDKTVDLNGLVIKKDDVGAVRYYHCLSSGGGANITNKPSGVNGNFLLRVESIRKVSQTDYTNKQTLISTDTSREYVRYCSNGTFSAWREVVVSGQNQDVNVKTLSATGRLSGGELAVGGNGSLNGNVSVGGGSLSAIPSQDKGVIMGKGSMVRDTSDGRLVLSSSGGTEKKLSLRPAGANASNNGVEISCTAASAGDTKMAFGQGAAMRCNNSGSLILSSKEGQLLYLRAAGDAKSDGQVTLSSAGTLTLSGEVVTPKATVNGALTANSARVNGDATVTGGLTVNNSATVSGGITAKTGNVVVSSGGIEIFNSTPYIDFHFNKSTADYTARLIEESAGNLTLYGGFKSKSYIYAQGAMLCWNNAPSSPAIGALVTGAPHQSMIMNRGANGDSRGAVANFYIEEIVGTNHRAVIYLDGFGKTDAWIFNSGGVIDTPTGAVQTSGSDVRIKTDFEEAAEGARDRIMKLGVSEFKMIGDDRKRRGFIAQQADSVDEVYTFLGSEMEINGEKIQVLNVDQTAIIADMVTTIQEQDAEIKGLKSEIAELREMIQSLINK